MKILYLIFLINFVTFGNELPNSLIVPGGVIELYVKSSSKPKAFHNKKELMVLKSSTKNRYRVIAGVKLDFDVDNKYEIVLKYDGKSYKKNVQIKSYDYKKQYIKLKTSKHVNLSSKNLSRYQKERKKSLNALGLFSEKKFDTLNMMMPLHVELKDDFGKRRYFNNQPRKPHSGVDLAAKSGTKIYAPLSAKVVISEEFFFNGNTIYLDHGLGLVTVYAHLSKLNVKNGDMVKKGDVIGLVGKTGRVTGSHLHWGVALNGSMVNPKLFFPIIQTKK
ncbi:MAG: M23 family metallopeptidase [Campylobacterota bacterium]|nr:M23 family metallopeptidase [Campylobacterota bacterium]